MGRVLRNILAMYGRKIPPDLLDGHLPPMQGKAVVVLHGLFRSRSSMTKMCAYLHREGGRLGSAVGVLYTFNTAGSALACFLTAGVLFRYLGLTGSVWFAATCNLLTGWLVFVYCRRMATAKA